jgi:hypothetical protein
MSFEEIINVIKAFFKAIADVFAALFGKTFAEFFSKP